MKNYNQYPRKIVTRSGEEIEGLLYFQISTSAYPVVFFSILATNCFMYIKILSTLRARKGNRSLQTSEDCERNIQQMATMVVANGVIFFLCSSIFTINQLYFAVSSFDHNFLNRSQINIFQNVRLLFIIINASVNPLVYVSTNQRYRQALKTSTLCKIKTHNYRASSNIVLNTL